MGGPVSRHHLRRGVRRLPRGLAVLLATLSLIGLDLAGLGASLTSAGATPSISSLTLPTTGLNPTASGSTLDTRAISCPSASLCVATGYYLVASPAVGYDGFVATGVSNGGAWTWTMSTLPTASLTASAPPSFPITYPFAISCPSSASCVASGQYIDANNGYDGFFAAGTLSGSTWTWAVSTMPTSALSPSPAATPIMSPEGISCPTTSRCVATGYYRDGAGRQDGYGAAGTLSAGAWTWTTTTLSTATMANGTASNFVSPAAVTCLSSTSCLATGQYHNNSGYTYSFYATVILSGSTWAWTLSTLPTTGVSPAANTYTEVQANAVSCPSTSTCEIAGQYYDTSGGFDGFVDAGTLNGSTWTWSAATLPESGLSPASNTSAYVTPTSVSCSSTSACVASGSYSDTSGDYEGFYAQGTLSASTWTWTSSTVPTAGLSPASKPASFTGDFTAEVSCPSTARCVLAGSYVDATSHTNGYDSQLTFLPAASTPSITNLPAVATVGDKFTAVISTDGDGAVGLTSTTPSTCSVSGLVVRFVANGTCTLVASVADGSTYAGATGTAQSLSVTSVSTTTIPTGTHATQSKLVVSTRKDSFSLHAVVTLSTSGGSGSGKVSFRLVHGRCTLKSNKLSAKAASACSVVATKAGTSKYKSRSSTATTFFFGFVAQSPLTLKVSSTVNKISTRVALSTTGGSGKGAVTFTVTGAHCALSRTTLHVSAATTCVVSATKAWNGTFLPASSKPVSVRFF